MDKNTELTVRICKDLILTALARLEIMIPIKDYDRLFLILRAKRYDGYVVQENELKDVWDAIEAYIKRPEEDAGP